MFAIEKSEIELINQVANLINPSDDMNKMGDWGILYLVCGSLYGQTMEGASSIIEGLPSQYEVISHWFTKYNTDEELAVIFSNYLKKWSQDETGKKFASIRLNKIFEDEGINIKDKIYTCNLEYLTLAIMLNSLKNIDCYDDFNEVKEWAKNNECGWQKLFFGAGLFLSLDDDFLWRDYRNSIKSFTGEYKEKINYLFDYFRKKD